MAKTIHIPRGNGRLVGPSVGVVINGREQRVAIGVETSVSDEVAALLTDLGVPQTVPAVPNGMILIPRSAGSRIPVSINGKLEYLVAGTPIVATDAQRALLAEKGISFMVGGSPYGPELIVDGTFDTQNSWFDDAGPAQIANGKVTLPGGNILSSVVAPNPAPVGRYRFSLTVVSTVSAMGEILVGNIIGSETDFITIRATGPGTYVEEIITTGAIPDTGTFSVFNNTGNTIVLDDFSIRRVL